MNVLVTGASGFVGRKLCRNLEDEGHTLVRLNSKNCDLTKQESLQKFNDVRYDRIFHLAAWTQAGDFCLHHQGEQWIINQLINTNVLHWWQEFQPQAKLVCMGSSCAYDPGLPLTEDNYLTGTPIESLYTYAMTKRMLYIGLLALAKQFHLKYLYLVPSTIYGPDYHTDKRQMHFIFDIIRKVIRGQLYREEVILWGDGHQKRELVFVDDFVNITLRLAGKVENEIVNIGAGEEFSISHFARLVCEKVGYDFSAIRFDTTRYTGATSKCLVVDKLNLILPQLRLTPLETGLDETITWFWKNKKKLFPAGR